MKVTTKGLILALKNLGTWLGAYTAAGIQSDPYQFTLSLVVFLLISTPTDLFLLNHLSNSKAKQ